MPRPVKSRYVRGTAFVEYRWHPIRREWQAFSLFTAAFFHRKIGVWFPTHFASNVHMVPRAPLLQFGMFQHIVSYASTWAEPEQDPYPGDDQ